MIEIDESLFIQDRINVLAWMEAIIVVLNSDELLSVVE